MEDTKSKNSLIENDK